MTARDALHARLYKGPTENRDDLIDAYRAEVLAEAEAVAVRAARGCGDDERGQYAASVAAGVTKELRRMAAVGPAGKDTSDATQAPAGESTQPADDEVTSAIRRAIADFPFTGYGIDHDGADPAWVADLASTITGAIGGEAL